MKINSVKVQHFLPFKNGSVCWHEFGSGKPLILLHGGHGSWEHWVKNIAALATKFRVLVPDMPGYGQSSMVEDNTLVNLLEPLIQTMNQLVGGTTEIYLAGFSFGGYAAIHLANQRKCVKKIALIGPAGHGRLRRPRGDLLSWRQSYLDQNWNLFDEIMQTNLYLHMLSSRNAVDELSLRIHKDACLKTRFRSKEISRTGGLLGQLKLYQEPILIIFGEHDVTATPRDLEGVLLDGTLNRQYEIVNDAGHWVQYEQHEKVNSMLLEWF